MLRACDTWDVSGDPDPETWTYLLTIPGPSATISKTVRSEAVVHVRSGAPGEHPWRGVSPLEAASTTGTLAAHLEGRLSQEASAVVGQLISTPEDPSSKKYDPLRADLGRLAGGVLLVPSLSTGGRYGQTGSGGPSPSTEWRSNRLGAHPPAVLDSLRTSAGQSVAAACGVPVALLAGGADAAGLREAWRQFIFGSVLPLSALVVAELRDKLDAPALALAFDSLGASDIQGRARALKAMTDAGIPLEDARRLAGLD